MSSTKHSQAAVSAANGQQVHCVTNGRVANRAAGKTKSDYLIAENVAEFIYYIRGRSGIILAQAGSDYYANSEMRTSNDQPYKTNSNRHFSNQRSRATGGGSSPPPVTPNCKHFQL
jgi:hypothetical protein